MMRICSRSFFTRYGASITSAVSSGISLFQSYLSPQGVVFAKRHFSSSPKLTFKAPVAYPLFQGINYNTTQSMLAKRINFATRPLFTKDDEYVGLNCAMNVFMPGLPIQLVDKIQVADVIEE